MANTSSAKKAVRQQRRRTVRNLEKKTAMLDIIRSIRKLVASGKKTEAAKLLSIAYKVFDKAAKTGYIKKNTAARNKSRLAKLIK